MKYAIIVILSAFMLTGTSAFAGIPFTKPVPSKRNATRPTARTLVQPFDTVCTPPSDTIAVSGFEKTLRARRESMYITNRMADTVEGVRIEVTYTDMDGRMLHRAAHDVSCHIPAGETRLIDIPSFDRQGLYYYYLSPVPTRASRATPFKVEVSVQYVLIPKKE